MSIPEELRSELNTRIDTLLGFQVERESLIRDGKEFSFALVKEKIDWFFAKSNTIKNSIEEIARTWPDQQVREYSTQIEQITSALQKIKQFSPEQISSPGPEKDALISTIEGLYSSNFSKWQSDLLSLEKGPTLSEDAIKKVLKEVTTKKADIDEILKQSQEVYKSIQNAAGSTGVQRYSNVFEKQANSYRRGGNIWLAVMVVGFLLAAAFLVIFISNFEHDLQSIKDPTSLIQTLAAKLVVITVIFYGLHWISRNYSAQRHLEASNRHRQNSLEVFKAFVDATEDKQIKDQVLQIAATSIFTIGETGYISQGDDGGTSIKLLDQLIPKR